MVWVNKQLTCLITISFFIKVIFTQGGCNISYCQQCDALNLNCLQCQADFILNPQSNICLSKCLFGTYYDFNVSSCIPICNNGYAQDETHRVCIQTQPCHSLQSPNGLVYKYNKIAQIYKNYVIVCGSDDNTSNSNTLNLLSYDLTTGTALSHIGYLSQNGGPIIFFHISTNSQNQDIIYSFSRTQITAFELNSGMQINSYTLLNGFFVDASTYYIDNNYLIVFCYRNQQFAVLQYQQQLSNNCGSQQCLITFQRVHINPIIGFILDSQGNIISYAPDGMIIQWSIQNQSYQTILSNQNYEISSLCLSIIQQNQQVFAFSIQNDSNNQVYINVNNKVNSFQLGFTSPILEILDYNQLIQSSSKNMNSYSIIIIRSSSQLMLVKFQFGQQITTQNLLSASINPIITKAIKGYFYLVLQANGIYSINQSNGQYSLQLINQIQLSSFNYISDLEPFTLNNTSSGYSFLLVAKQLKIIAPQTQTTVDPYNGIQQQVSPSYQQHHKWINGVLYDPTLNVYLSFSQDGSFAVWDIFMYDIFKMKPLFFVFPPWCQQYQTCSTSIINALLFQTGIFICQYSNSVIISWNYNRIQAFVRQTYVMQNQTDTIKQFKMLGLKYLFFCNTNEIRIYDFSQSETNIINNNYQFIQDYLIKIELGLDNNNILYLIELARQQSDQYILRLRITDQYYSQINLVNLTRKGVDLYYNYQNQRLFVNVEQDLIGACYFPQLQFIYLFNVGNSNNWIRTFSYSWQTDQFITINQNGQMCLWKYIIQYKTYNVVIRLQYPIPRTNYQLLEQKQILAASQGFVMYQNTQSQLIDNQVIGMDFIYLKPCFVYPFKNEINGIYISDDSTLFISFTNGDLYFTQYSCSIEQYVFGQANTTQIIHNQYLRKSYLFQKQQMVIVDYYSQEVAYNNYPHQLNTYQALEDTQNNFLVTYSQEQSTNLYKYSMVANTYIQFLNGHMYSVNYAFLDIDNDVLISFSSDPRDLNLILWEYSSTSQIVQFSDIQMHVSTNSSIQIVNLLIYKQQNLVYALLSDGYLFQFNYVQKAVNFLQIDPGAINFWIDETYGNVFILLNSNALQVRTIKTFQIIAQLIFTQNVNNPQNIMYTNNYVFVFLSNALSIVSRTKLSQIQQIDCSAQPCLDACFSEKLDQLFLYSSYQSDSVYVYQAISGQLLYSIYGVSDLNKGQISSVIIDDDDYLLIIGKLDNFISVFFNYYTKQEVGYFFDSIVQYKYSKFIPELNVFIQSQFYNFEPFSIQNMITSTFQTQSFYISKWLDYYTDSKNNIYYVDGSNIMRNINLLLLASGDIWNYNFNLNINQNQVSVSNQQQCSLFINDPSKSFQVENQLLQLQNYFSDTGNIQSQPNVVIQGAEFLFYSNIMNDLKALVVYQGDSTDSLLMLYNDSFSKNSLYTLNIKNTFITISKQSAQITLNPQTQEIKFYNVTISQEQPNTPSQASILITQIENAILKNITIQNITISNNTTFLNFNSATNLNIQNLVISNVQMHINSTLISFQQITSLQINNLTLQNVTILTDNSSNSSSLANQIFVFNKVKQLQVLNTTFSNIKSQIRSVIFQLIQNLECAFQGLLVDQLYNIQFIKNKNYDSSTQFTYIDTQDTFQIMNSKFSNYFSDLDSLICYQGSLLNIQNTTFQNSSCKSCTGTVLQIQGSSQILINSSTFQNNSGYNGGAISISDCQNSNIQINQCNFTSNYAWFSGGAIYLMDSEIQMQQTIFTSNIAFIGGAIRYLTYKPQIFYSSSLQSQVQFIQNKAYIHSQNWGSYPQSINVIFINSISSRVLTTKTYNFKRNTNQNSDFTLKNIQSGGFLNLSFQLLDEEGNLVTYDYQNCLNKIYSQDLCNEIQQISINLISQDDSKMRVLGSYITKYQEFIIQNKTFQINGVQLVGNPLSNQTMLVYVSGIVTYSSNLQISNPYYAQVQVEFRDCLIGELIEQSNDFYECNPCPYGTYSIQKPQINQAQKCIKCPQEAQFCQQNQMTLIKGYWKSSNFSDSIYSCTQSKNCEGNQTTNYCSIGHAGPLCQFCDEKGAIWGEQYQFTVSNQCDLCSGQSQTQSLGVAFLVCLGLIIYCTINIFTMIASGEKISQSYYLRRMKLVSLSNTCYKQIQINLSIKSLTNFMQMLKLMSTQTLQLPVSITIAPDLIGSPSSSYVFSTSCFLATLQTDTFKPLFIKLISVSISPFIYILSLIVIYLFINPFLKGFQFSKSKIISIIVFVFWFLKPSIVYTLIQGISCVNFDGKKYIQLDYTYECYTETHLQFIYYLLIPSLIFYIIIVPGIILKKISSNKNNLDYATVRQSYGYIYQDYRKVGFYWEFVRFTVQLIVIFYQNLELISSNTKSLLTMSILIVYYIALSIIKPFMMKKYQRVEEQSTIVLIFISVLNLALANNSSSTRTLAFQVVLFVPYYMNMGYLIYLIITTSLIPQLQNCYRKFLGVISNEKKLTNNSLQMQNQIIKQRVLYLWKQAYLKLFICQMNQSKKIDQMNQTLVNINQQSTIAQKKFSINLANNINRKTRISSFSPSPTNIKSKFAATFEMKNSISRQRSIYSNDSFILKQRSDSIETDMNNLYTRPLETLEQVIKDQRNPYMQNATKDKPEQ
ncbi:transmembrane protein, putative (macronuclear) [Tetrahymena thermophila SB210]|uniref:Transmembrane protein, putative n=1 Tax=Tetrahymena thermophila (strain SB210) TaxID=312017 RepID=Q22M52_TETTS|nr:transmembrane protein, putative [Tetrahymena thermophila SB210]EAR86259.2 transmembrane protein, putative [Tetrahymena thermophila SB210]|eukprot:XP_977168.2 transmembrane protein, putative [Tetrahymena thermophila SB210]